MAALDPDDDAPLSVFVISGGSGAAGQLLLDTLLAQFPAQSARVVCHSDQRTVEQLDHVLELARATKALVVHSLVDEAQRRHLSERAESLGVETHDLFGDLMHRLELRLGCAPVAVPGRYRRLRRDYFERIEAINFAVEHDDSQHLPSLDQAEIVLVGVSRAGKTPLSMYLAMQGWKTANIAFVPNTAWPSELERVDHGRIVGLHIEHERLLTYRKRRSLEVGLGRSTPYSTDTSVFLELETLRDEFKRRRVPVVDVTDKPLESSAQEVIELVTRFMGGHARRR